MSYIYIYIWFVTYFLGIQFYIQKNIYIYTIRNIDIEVWMLVVKGRVFAPALTNTLFKNESMTVHILFLEYVTWN